MFGSTVFSVKVFGSKTCEANVQTSTFDNRFYLNSTHSLTPKSESQLSGLKAGFGRFRKFSGDFALISKLAFARQSWPWRAGAGMLKQC
ncbi:MAG: hypothetical protein ABJM43_14385 [Paracoccaceae bacterium]